MSSPSENKETNNGTSVPKENDDVAEENPSVAKPDKESSGAVDFDLALDYEEMDVPHSENEGEIKEDANAKSSQHSHPKPKDDAESSDDSSGQGTHYFVLVHFEILVLFDSCLLVLFSFLI